MPRRSTSKKSQKKSIGIQIALVIAIAVVGLVAYKYIFLSSLITRQLPEPALTKSLEQCFQTHLSASMLNNALSAAGVQGSHNASNATDTAKSDFNVGGVDVGSLLGGVWGQVSNHVVETRIAQNYITEIKVLKVQDLLGDNAEMRITGRVDLVSQAPVVGDVKSEKNYQTQLFKRGNAYYFESLSVKALDAGQWTAWACAQTL